MNNNALQVNRGGYKQRSSNFELYRILCMLMIVAHHYVVNSGLTSPDSPMLANSTSANTLYLWLFGMWGKTGINCFLLITGYFMCKSTITLRKFAKLLLEIYFYQIVIYVALLIAGYESVSPIRLAKLAMPVWGFNQNFLSCFIGFWLTIPFWNILIQNMTKKQHQLLLILLLGLYTILGTVPKFHITFNYITWFGVIYLIASYIRMYPCKAFENNKLWGLILLASVILSMLSVYAFECVIGQGSYFFVSDSNKFFAVLVAVSSFLLIKNIDMPYSKVINLIGGSTFGVFLIHAQSEAMRQWLWRDTVDCVGHYSLPLSQLVLFSIGTVLAIFFICILIDRIRIKVFEEPFFKWYDRKPLFERFTSWLSDTQ